MYFENERLSWEDIRLFLAVARSGGLAAASEASGASAPTLSRRMSGLERSLGTSLFRRHRNGYDLTAEGEGLLALAEEVELGTLAIERWRMAADPRPRVRIASGAWTAAFLAGRLPVLLKSAGAPCVALLSGTAPVDLLRREANLGIRNRRPDALGLAGRKLARVAFAAYGAPDAEQEWIAFDPGGSTPPSVSWLEQNLRKPASLRCTSTHAVLEAARAGAGQCILPCFIGDRATGLVRKSGLIEELTHDQWLVSHDEDRHDQSVRKVSNWLAELWSRHKAVFAGERPSPPAP